ncbi:MAG: homoserine O-acetyltransferase MetA [Lachnospiraceae bacterium]|jgi:homoserine O-succinyltransferase
MPINVQSDLPAKKIMEEENIFMMDQIRAGSQDIRPLRIAILNLMPLKEDTEVHLLRCLSNTPLQVEITFLTTASYVGTNTSKNHLDQFYLTYNDIKDNFYDGLIITGAPVENKDWEDVIYWNEITQIMEWSKMHVTSTLHICWGAQAGIYYHYGIDKYELDSKISGIFTHRVHNRKVPLLRGFDDIFLAPHSRYTEIRKEDVEKNPDLTILADSEEVGLFLVMAQNGKQIFMFGHPEYDRLTLDSEYKRDLGRGLNPKVPVNYYKDDNPDNKPLLTWRAHSNALYTNWLNYYVYQETPYEF